MIGVHGEFWFELWSIVNCSWDTVEFATKTSMVEEDLASQRHFDIMIFNRPHTWFNTRDGSMSRRRKGNSVCARVRPSRITFWPHNQRCTNVHGMHTCILCCGVRVTMCVCVWYTIRRATLTLYPHTPTRKRLPIFMFCATSINTSAHDTRPTITASVGTVL